MRDLFLGMTKLYRRREQFRTLALDVARAAAYSLLLYILTWMKCVDSQPKVFAHPFSRISYDLSFQRSQNSYLNIARA